MASLQASSLLSSSSSSSAAIRRTISSSLHIPNLQKSVPQRPVQNLVKELNSRRDNGLGTVPLHIDLLKGFRSIQQNMQDLQKAKLYAILEAIGDRIEMHKNIGEQRQNWNTLLLNSINMITLAATMMAAIAVAADAGRPLLALKSSSTLLFTAATGVLSIMNKIQPSQLAEEQRNAVRLFKQLQGRLQTTLALETPTEADVEDAMDRVLALDSAYPLPLLGAMLNKFPKSFEPAAWWPSMHNQRQQERENMTRTWQKNGWNPELEGECKDIVRVMKQKDEADYVKLGNKALCLSKMLAISGPLLTGLAAVGSAFIGSPTYGPWGALVAAIAGSLASTVNTFAHGGQVGMVFEMYRNSAGFFQHLEETVESTLEEEEMGKRENGELFEMKMALSLGRSLSQLRELAAASRSCDEFASKLF